jgi:hypothetical protein
MKYSPLTHSCSKRNLCICKKDRMEYRDTSAAKTAFNTVFIYLAVTGSGLPLLLCSNNRYQLIVTSLNGEHRKKTIGVISPGNKKDSYPTDDATISAG